MQCNHYDQTKCDQLTKKGMPQEQAMNQTRCIAPSVPGYTRCKEHGGGDISEFFTRDMKPDEKIRFKELYENMIEQFNISRTNLYILNLLAANARAIICAHSANPDDIQKHINQSLQLGKELTLTPKERKHKELHIHMDENLKEHAESIENIVRERIALTE